MLNTKTLKKLLIITTICAVPVVLIAIKSGKSIIRDDGLFFPDLLRNQENIYKVIVQDHNNTLTLYKSSGTWKILERDNYPVLADRVDDLLLSLGDLRIIEPKTSKPELYEQLDVNDIKDENSKAVLIVVLNDKNEELANMYIGKREGLRVGEEYQEHIFIRRAGEEQAWLVRGILPLSNNFMDWVEQPLLGIVDSDQVSSIEIIRPETSKVRIYKNQLDQEDFILEASASKKGMSLDIDSINSLPFEVAELEFKNVFPADNIKLDWDKSITANLETFPGVKVLLNIVKQDQKVFVKVHADASSEASNEILNKVDAYNKAKQDWVFEVPSEFYYAVTVAKNDFLRPEIIDLVG